VLARPREFVVLTTAVDVVVADLNHEVLRFFFSLLSSSPLFFTSSISFLPDLDPLLLLLLLLLFLCALDDGKC
jgi:hypothetical protein